MQPASFHCLVDRNRSVFDGCLSASKYTGALTKQQANRPTLLSCSEQVDRRYYHAASKYTGVLTIQQANRLVLLPCSKQIDRRSYHAASKYIGVIIMK